ncbi:rhomboid family intramembrane serine protease [Chryseolinea soli]|uniref:Rhomboid family intramembrane serine protease n=1 Tax=Chryseolinea soli TaxID=2321403 RepID=A0A385SPE6_9BACT|nr:rhomboid family intramembrane serine protease [Chryseolinea soli]AYB32416.1 rhomboid family intramembrane serine protease [Chryseolinea soli]
MKNQPIATYVLMAINVVAYAIMATYQQSPLLDPVDIVTILNAGANFNPFTLGGEPWRLVTSMFLHGHVLHLLVNMFALYSLGRDLEGDVGPLRFVILYFICGLAGGLASLAFNVYVPSVGASGALFGLYAYRLGADLMGTYDDRRQFTLVIINFVIFLVIMTAVSFLMNLDHAAHAGGFVAGLVLAVLHVKLRAFIDNRHLAVIAIALPFTLLLLPKSQVQYYRIYQRVRATEDKTHHYFRDLRTDAELGDSLHLILTRWQGIRQSLKDIPSVPQALASDTASMKMYVSFREEETGYRINLIERESYVYMDSLEVVAAKFSTVPPLQYGLNFTTPPREPEPDSTETASPAMEMKKVFFDSAWHETDDPNTARFYRIGTQDSAGRWQGAVRDYYRDGTIQMKGQYLRGMKNGIFLYYSERGTYTSAGRYDKEESIGRWEIYHWNGKLESEVFYNGQGYTRSVWDSLGNPQVENGRGKAIRWYATGQVSEEGPYQNGRRDGDWYGFHPDGKPYFHEIYRDNRIIRGMSEDRGKRYVYDQTSLYAFPVNGMAEYRKYLFLHTRKPPGFKSGTVKVVFNVGVDGSMWDFVVIEGVSPEHDAEAIRVVKEGPAWRPGLLHGHEKLPSQGYIEVIF